MQAFRPSQRLRPLLLDPKKPYVHRDLSWLQFNERILDEADLTTNPLLERARFLAISASNFDEFFMIRMASLGRAIAVELRRRNKPQLSRLRRIPSVILSKVKRHTERQTNTLAALAPNLSVAGIQIVVDPSASEETLTIGKTLFNEQILPYLPMPEPYNESQLRTIENLQIAALFTNGTFLRIPKKLKPVLSFRDQATGQTLFFFLDRLVETFASSVLGLHEAPLVIRVTRDADLSVDLEDEDSESIQMSCSLG